MSATVYMICGLRPVYSQQTPDGGLAIYALQWESGEFQLDMSYLTRLHGYANADDEEVAAEDFWTAVSKIRANLKGKRI